MTIQREDHGDHHELDGASADSSPGPVLPGYLRVKKISLPSSAFRLHSFCYLSYLRYLRVEKIGLPPSGISAN